jgi:hypothetical protein
MKYIIYLESLETHCSGIPNLVNPKPNREKENGWYDDHGRFCTIVLGSVKLKKKGFEGEAWLRQVKKIWELLGFLVQACHGRQELRLAGQRSVRNGQSTWQQLGVGSDTIL